MKVLWTTSELKEITLVGLSTLWGLILLYPGNTFVPSSQVGRLGLYAEDWVWGVILLSFSVPMLFINKQRHMGFRKAAHAFYWIFWLGISLLLWFRTAVGGPQPTDFLLVLPFITIALLHAIIYAGLGRDL